MSKWRAEKKPGGDRIVRNRRADHLVDPTASHAKPRAANAHRRIRFEKRHLRFQPARMSNVVSIHSQKNARVVLNEPRSYDEAQEIADHLRSRRSVVVNLQRVRTEHAIRIVDFLGGTVYALNGTISKLGPNIFLCTPDTVEISGTITDMLTEEFEINKMR